VAEVHKVVPDVNQLLVRGEELQQARVWAAPRQRVQQQVEHLRARRVG